MTDLARARPAARALIETRRATSSGSPIEIRVGDREYHVFRTTINEWITVGQRKVILGDWLGTPFGEYGAADALHEPASAQGIDQFIADCPELTRALSGNQGSPGIAANSTHNN